MSPTTVTMSVTVTSRSVCIAMRAAAAVNRRDRNCSSARPRRTRSPDLIPTGIGRSIRFPLSLVPFVLWSVSPA